MCENPRGRPWPQCLLISLITHLLLLVGLLGWALTAVSMINPAQAQEAGLQLILGMAVLMFVPGRLGRLTFLILCAWVVLRYMSWRYIGLDLSGSPGEAIGTVALFLAECYGAIMLLLGLFVNASPLERKPVPLPEDKTKWPTVDIYIPTYSEGLEVVAPTLIAACAIDYPADKYRVYVLDDGWPRAHNPKTPGTVAHELLERSAALKALCARHGATWLGRENNLHAKSGNMNAAMEQTSGELILVLDADHVPTRDILANTIGLMVQDPKLAFVQTPHFFVNPDPVERNLKLYQRMPAENDMFYRTVQKGLDLWNAAFFCGSAAVLRRRALQEVGGFSTKSITEDASTSVVMHQRGWRSAYLGIPMVAGLQPETFTGFMMQRLRWATGMMQIFIKQNPLLIRGLSMAQRMSYLSVIFFWFFPFARIVFFLAPLTAIFFDWRVYPLGTDYFIAYTLPYLTAVLLSFERSFGRVRRILISELYETLQSFYTLPALLATIVAPNKPSFKVTPKGETLSKEFISQLNRPFYLFYAITVAGLVWGSVRWATEDGNRLAMSLAVLWSVFNFVLLSAALGVLLERPQRRRRPRIDLDQRVKLLSEQGAPVDALVLDGSETAIRVRFFQRQTTLQGLTLLHEGVLLPLRPLGDSQAQESLEAVFEFELAQPEQESAAILLSYGDSSRWAEQWGRRESSRNVLGSAVMTAYLGIREGVRHLRKLTPD